MFHSRSAMRDEQAAQLQELNSRLGVYLSRVRQLEQENQFLVEEIQSLRLDREVEWKREYEAEISQLRRKVEELTLEKSQAEIERDSLWQEFQLLQLLCGEVQAIRREIDKELVFHRADLKQAEDSHSALEQLLLQLHGEYEMLVGSCEQEVADLRGGLLRFPVQVVKQQQCRVPSLSLHEVEGYDLEISQSWKETFLMYQRKVEELGRALRTSGEIMEDVEEEKRLRILEMGELQGEVEELDRIRQSLEEELRSMREKVSVQVEEYQIIIESLEDEKQSLALTITDRLKDYHELMQAKTGLSLEVAAYRALLEGENNKGMLTWTEEQMSEIQQGSQGNAHERIGSYSLQPRENTRRCYPAIQSRVDTRHKTRLSHITSSVPRSSAGSQGRGLGGAVEKDVQISSYRPPASVREEASYQRSTLSHTGFQTFSPAHSLSRRPETHRHTIPTGGAAMFLANQSTRNFQRSSKDVRDAPQAGLSQATKPQLENGNTPSGYELSWELRGTKQVKREGLVMSKEKTKEEEPSKVATKRTPREDTKGNRAVHVERILAPEEKTVRGAKSYVFEIQTENKLASEKESVSQERLKDIDAAIKVMGIGKVQENNVEDNQIQREGNLRAKERATSEGENDTQEGRTTIEIPIQVMGARERREEGPGIIIQAQREENLRAKERAKSEGGNDTQEGRTTIEIPIQVIGARERQEGSGIIVQTQREGELRAKQRATSEGENDTQEGRTTIEIPIQVIGARATPEARAGINQSQREINFIVREQVKEDKSAARESSVESEERIRGHEPTRDNTSWTVEEKSSEGPHTYHHVPISSEGHGKDQASQNNNIQITVRGSADTDANKDFDKPAENLEFNVAAGESDLNTDEEVSAEHSSTMGMSWAEGMPENVTVADILKHFGQSSDLEATEGASSDAKVTYAERKQFADDGTVTTEIIVQSTTEEDFDMSDEEELEHLLNKSMEKTTLKQLKGAQAESFLENILHGSLKGKKSVSVEITEEPLESAMGEQGEFSVPFEVEEADDASPAWKEYDRADEEALHVSMSPEELKDGTPPRGDTTHVEDVTEAGDTGEDLEYIVSTPDDFPVGHGEHEDSLYGQVHIEEESSIQYSWHDEFLPSSQKRKTTSDVQEHDTTDQTQLGASEETNTYLVEEEPPRKEPTHVEGFVIEKEIKIPQDFQTSIMGLLSEEMKDPKHHLKGALEQLEGSLPGILRDELSALTAEGQEDSNNLAVDIKKVEQTTDNGVVTIVAEINVSQTVEADHFDALNNLEGSTNITEEALLQSLKHDISEKLESHGQESIGKSIEIDVSTSGNKSLMYSSSKLNTDNDVACSTAEESLQERPVSEPPENSLTEDMNQTQMSADMNRFVRHVKLGPQEIQTIEHVIFEGPISERVELGTTGNHSPTEGLSDVSRSMRHFKLGPVEIHTTQQIISEGAASDTLEHGGDVSLTEGSTDVNRSIRHIKLGPREMYSSEQIIFEGTTSETQVLGDLSPTEGAADINRSIRHIKLGPREIYSSEQIIFEGPISETQVLGDLSPTEGAADINRSIRHIKLGPREMHSSEQIIFEGPVSETQVRGDLSPAEGAADINRSIRHIKLGSKEIQAAEQIVFEGPICDSSGKQDSGDMSANVNRSIKHFKLSPTETLAAEHIIFKGPLSQMAEHADTENLSESGISRSIRHIELGSKIQATGQIIFEGAISEPLQLGGAAGHAQKEEPADAHSYVRHIKLSPTDLQNSQQIIFEGPISETLGGLGESSPSKESTETTTSVRHIKIGSREMQTSEEATFEHPVLERLGSSTAGELPLPDESLEANRSVRHIKLGPKEKSFTFQMDVTQFAAVPSVEGGTQDSTVIFSSRTFAEKPNVALTQRENEGDQEDAENANGGAASADIVPDPYEEYFQARGQKVIDTSKFDKTVQLQRMVDQRSMISDDKKIAIVYLDNEENS